MQRVFAAVGISFLLVTLPAFAAFAADPPSAADDASLQKGCLKLAVDPFAGSGPKEWSTPFQSIDPFQAIPVCKEALRRHPNDARLKLAAAFAYVAGRKNDQARPLLDDLVAKGNSDAMLALAFISSGAEAAELMSKAAEGGNASGMMLYGMAQIFGKGVPKDETEGVRTLRRAAEAGSTRAMLVLANSITRAITALVTILARPGGCSSRRQVLAIQAPRKPLPILSRTPLRTRRRIRTRQAAIAPIDADKRGLPDPRLDLANPNPYMPHKDCPWPQQTAAGEGV